MFVTVGPEGFVLLISAALLYVAYGVVYPRWARHDLKRLAIYDLAFTGIVVVVTGVMYASTHPTFTLLSVRLPWWAYAVIVYGLLELPLYVAYTRRAARDGHGSDATGFPDDRSS